MDYDNYYLHIYFWKLHFLVKCSPNFVSFKPFILNSDDYHFSVTLILRGGRLHELRKDQIKYFNDLVAKCAWLMLIRGHFFSWTRDIWCSFSVLDCQTLEWPWDYGLIMSSNCRILLENIFITNWKIWNEVWANLLIVQKRVIKKHWGAGRYQNEKQNGIASY